MDEPVSSHTPSPERCRRPYLGRNSHYIVRDLCTVLQQQMDALAEYSIDDFSDQELNEYRLRAAKIRALREELGEFSLWTSS
jgi:hypothetical protein